jgi:hypothetical protein
MIKKEIKVNLKMVERMLRKLSLSIILKRNKLENYLIKKILRILNYTD